MMCHAIYAISSLAIPRYVYLALGTASTGTLEGISSRDTVT